MSSKDYALAATKGEPLMAFWTVVTIGYIFTISGHLLIIPILIVSTFLSSVAYFELNQIKKIVKSSGKKYSTGRWNNEPRWKVASQMYKDVTESGLFTTGLIITGFNLILGALAYLVIAYYLFTGVIDRTLIVLFVLPLIWLFTLLWRFIKITGE